MNRRWLRLPDSILSHTLILVAGLVLMLTAVNVGIILMRPPPSNSRVSAYEVARLLRGQPVARGNATFSTTISEQAPPISGGGKGNDLLRLSIGRFLGLSSEQVRLDLSGSSPDGPRRGRGALFEREFELYGADNQFNPIIFGSFTAAAKLTDGRWHIVSRVSHDPFRSWQMETALRFLISVLLVLPIVWLFSNRLARPIRAFATAADRLGREQVAEQVDVGGPAEIRRAALAVNEMQTRLRRYILERTSVVGAIAHDLRTPLSRLNFHLASAPEEIRRKAEAEIAEMEQMITTTLDFVQNETQVRPHEALDLALLVEGVVDDLADLGHDVSVTQTACITVRGDPILLKRLFANILVNAITYGGRATVSLKADNGWAVIDVQDEGPGLSDEGLLRAFEPFYRAEASRNRGTGGTGLGLAIVKSAAAAHGGNVCLFNRAEGGLCARVSLPIDS